MIDFSVKIGGEAGFGIMTTGLIFSRISSRLGYSVLDYIEYPSLIRGGHNAYEIRVSDEEKTALKKNIDILICLNKETYDIHKHRLNSNSFILFDKEEFEIKEDFKKIAIPFRKILSQNNAREIMKNNIALGACFALLEADLQEFLNVIKDQFFKKGEAVVKFNQDLATIGYQYVVDNYSSFIVNWLKRKDNSSKKIVLSGNDAFCLGLVAADCRLYCAYPMTPSSSVLHTLASWQEKTGMVVRHSEDEIAVINTAIGASFAGIRAAVGTSGGGFALMVESVSLAGITETPIVIFLAQRPGPATGMPTWTEQGDLLFACFAGHGEFPKIVLAPGDQQEMIELALKAFNLADIYQLPVIVISDMYLSEGHKSVYEQKIKEIINQYQINRGKLQLKDQIAKSSTAIENYLRYKITPDGISWRILPSTDGFFYQANSYEHLEDGHTTEEAKPRIEQVDKRNRKWQTYLKNDYWPLNLYGEKEGEIVLVSWGSTKGIVLSALNKLKEKGIKACHYHFNHLYPLDSQKLKAYFSDKKRYILVENNSWGQFGKLLAMETGVLIKEKILRYDGRPLTDDEIVEYIINF